MFRNTTNNINIHYSTNSVKTNDKIFQYIQKTLFLAHFPNFWGKKIFWKIQLSCTTSYRFLASRKLMIQFQENTQTDGRTDRTTDRTDRPYFIGPFWLPPGGVQKTCKGNIIMFLVDGRSISRNKTSLNVLVHNVIHLLHFTFEIDKCHNNTWS